VKLKVADAVWVATAHLHQEHPDAEDFAIAEVIDRTVDEGLTEAKRISIQTHVYRHLVANREPRHATYRMLHEPKPGRRRLHWLNDPYHSGRQGAPDQLGTRVTPVLDDLPLELRPLLRWYAEISSQMASQPAEDSDPILALRGAGRGLWREEDPDQYVNRLRGSWQ